MNDMTPSRAAQVAAILKGGVDLHCHSGPAAMPRILDHHEALLEAAEAGFRAVLYKDHFYLGVAHAVMLEKLVPDTGVRLFSGVALNNASGGINPYAVEHAAAIGGKIVWLPTLSAKNHIDQSSGAAKSFPKTSIPMAAPIPLSGVDANGEILDDLKKCLDIIAAADMILAGGHLPAEELLKIFAEAKARGVKKMLVNHPTYIVNASDDQIREMVGMGVKMEHSICMFIEGKAHHWDGAELKRLIEVAGVDNTILSSDLGLQGSPRPIEGFRQVVNLLLDQQVSEGDLRRMIGANAAAMLDLDA